METLINRRDFLIIEYEELRLRFLPFQDKLNFCKNKKFNKSFIFKNKKNFIIGEKINSQIIKKVNEIDALTEIINDLQFLI